MGACSARGLSWLIKGDVGQEVASPSLAMAKIPLRPVCRHVPSWGCGLQGKRTKPCAPTAGYPLPAPSFPVGEVDSASPRLAEERRLRAAAACAPPVAGAASRAFLRPQAGPVREGLWLPRKPWTGPGSEENQGGVERASWGGGGLSS